ncbi:hypothetical protein ACFQWB_02065 [Paenibacillus thermoaerophilus]|uniref:Helicase XPB/Ssl2 N-terminal domain-containing protein n=1 Tax=Paenibacillus thermoaerophilus TaxID=1215385 RepID=A0ABW2UXV5_9BACL|nr:hypothetical protein [Paenibacillus thermoaerophilus]TMV19132.1 hypothetical protein FE781_01075 [Paenibacillus thermoaerophilus]
MNWRSFVDNWSRRDWETWTKAWRTWAGAAGYPEGGPEGDDPELWAEWCTSPRRLRPLVHALEDAERTVLTHMLRRHGSNPVPESALAGEWIGGLGPARIRLALLGLRRKGLVMALRKSGGDRHVAVPADTGLALHGLLFPLGEPGLAEEPTAGKRRREREAAPGGAGLAASVLGIARAAADEPFRLTRSGAVAKAGIRRLQAALSWGGGVEPDGTGAGIGYRRADIYGWPLAAALDQALAAGLVRVCGGGTVLAADEPAVLEAIGSGWEPFERRLMSRWHREAMPSELELYHGAAGLLQLAPADGWITLERLSGWYVRHGLGGGPASEGGICGQAVRLWRDWIRLLAAFGWMELRESGGFPEGAAFRWTRDPAARPVPGPEEAGRSDRVASPCLYVQPNLEVLAPPDAPPLLLWELQAVAVPAGRDLYASYRLDRQKIGRAVASGRDGRSIAAFLAANCRHELPEPVMQAILDWERAASSSGGPAHAPEAARPRSEAAEAGAAGNGPADDLRTDAGADGLLLTGRLDDGLWTADGHLPSDAELYPFLADIPSMWWKDSRQYHPTTRKQIVKLAVEAGTELLIGREGRLERFVPGRIAEEEGTWRVAGRGETGEVCLRPHEWEEMRLILPGINE